MMNGIVAALEKISLTNPRGSSGKRTGEGWHNLGLRKPRILEIIIMTFYHTATRFAPAETAPPYGARPRLADLSRESFAASTKRPIYSAMPLLAQPLSVTL